MAFIELSGINDAREPEAAPAGRYDLVVTDVEEKTFNSGRSGLVVSLDFDGDSEYFGFRHHLMFPQGEDVATTRAFILLQAKRFFELFEVSFDEGFDTDDLVGARATNAIVTQSEPNDEGRVYNGIHFAT